MPSSPITREKVPHFEFVCANAADLTEKNVRQTMADMFTMLHVRNGRHDDLNHCVAVFEVDDSTPDKEKTLKPWDFTFPGEYYRDRKTESVLETLATKYEHEAARYRERGHKSTVSPSVFKPGTLGLIVGSAPFLAKYAELNFERYGKLRSELLEVWYEFFFIKPRKFDGKQSRIETFNHLGWDVFNEKFYRGNFDAVIEKLRGTKILNAREMMERLEEEDRIALTTNGDT